jgi:sulfide dehydrogenase cytochrome subunit
MRKITLTGACLGLLCLGGGAIAEDMTVNRMLAAQCAQCHGTNGNAARGIEGLDDESYKDLYEDLIDMRSEDRPDDIMDHQALGYTDDQIRRIALYYGVLSGKAGESPELDD